MSTFDVFAHDDVNDDDDGVDDIDDGDDRLLRRLCRRLLFERRLRTDGCRFRGLNLDIW